MLMLLLQQLQIQLTPQRRCLLVKKSTQSTLNLLSSLGILRRHVRAAPGFFERVGQLYARNLE